MGISHEYHAARGHGRRGGAGGKLRLLGVIAAILILSFAITAILENGQKHQDEAEQTATAGTAQNILAPLPMQGSADADSATANGDSSATANAGGGTAVTLEQFGPARQTAGAYHVKAYDSSVIRQPGCGQVDLSYFSDAAFLGDSLTVAFRTTASTWAGRSSAATQVLARMPSSTGALSRAVCAGRKWRWMCWQPRGPKSCISCWAPTP